LRIFIENFNKKNYENEKNSKNWISLFGWILLIFNLIYLFIFFNPKKCYKIVEKGAKNYYEIES